MIYRYITRILNIVSGVVAEYAAFLEEKPLEKRAAPARLIAGFLVPTALGRPPARQFGADGDTPALHEFLALLGLRRERCIGRRERLRGGV